MATAPPRPDREAFLRRIEEQQNRLEAQSDEQDEFENRLKAIQNKIKNFEKKLEIRDVLYNSGEGLELMKYLSQCGIEDLSAIDESSLNCLVGYIVPAEEEGDNEKDGENSEQAVDSRRPSTLDSIREIDENLSEKPSTDQKVKAVNFDDSAVLPPPSQRRSLPMPEVIQRPMLEREVSALSTYDNETTPPITTAADIAERLEQIGEEERDFDSTASIPSMKPSTNKTLESLMMQKELLLLLEAQAKAVSEAHARLEMLGNELQEHTRLLQSFHAKYGAMFPRDTPAEDPQPTPAPPQPKLKIFHLLTLLTEAMFSPITTIRTRIQQTTIYRVFSHFFAEAERQNIQLFRIDLQLFIKLFLFFVFFGGRIQSAGYSSKSGVVSTAPWYIALWIKHRITILAFCMICVYLYQVGVLTFIIQFIRKDIPRFMEEDAARQQPQGRRPQRQHLPNAAVPAPTPPPQNQPPRTLMDGGIRRRAATPQTPQELAAIADANGGGFFQDIKYFIGSFLFSLLPTWRPVVVEPEGAGEQRPNEEAGEQNVAQG